MFKTGYYMVHKIGGGATSTVHDSHQAALEEAKRLAVKHIGDIFVVLRGMEVVQVELPKPTVQAIPYYL